MEIRMFTASYVSLSSAFVYYKDNTGISFTSVIHKSITRISLNTDMQRYGRKPYF